MSAASSQECVVCGRTLIDGECPVEGETHSQWQPTEFIGGRDDPYADLAFCGICQDCGAYWDVRKVKVCPCGGEVL